MKLTQTVVDDFYPAPQALALVAKSLSYDTQEYEGHTYHGVGLGFQPEGMSELLAKVVGGRVDIKLQYFRLGTATEQPTSYIHPDSSIAAFAAVLYLSEAPHGLQAGTAFWRHRKLGIDGMEGNDLTQPEVDEIVKDGEDESKWLMTSLIGQKFNRLSLYTGQQFHSRYPRDAWGNDKSDGRLTYCCFFNVT